MMRRFIVVRLESGFSEERLLAATDRTKVPLLFSASLRVW